MNWNVGDMCFFEFDLSQVKEMRGNNVTKVSNGYMNTSTGGSFNDRCFPVTLEIKLISDRYSSYSTKLHKQGLAGLNFPDIHRWLVAHWAETCSKPNNREWIGKRYRELQGFAQEILEKCQGTRDFVTSYGMPLFR